MASSSYIGDGVIESSFSADEKEVRVMFKVPMCGAIDPEPLLPEILREQLASDVEDLPRSLRQEDRPLLLASRLKLEVMETFEDKCLKNLWTCGMQPTMTPIAISANLETVSISMKT
jgi:hypothetical protein